MLLLNYMYELKYRAMQFDIIKMRKNIFSMEINMGYNCTNHL